MNDTKPNPDMYAVGGDVQASGGIYIPRSADDELLALCRSGTFSYVLTPRQMGKSSLMKRTVERLNEEGVRTVIIDLTQLGTDVTSESWHLGLLSAIEDQLSLSTDVLTWWDENKHLSTTQRMTDFFRKELMREITGQVVICIDEIDTTLSLNFTDDFYAAIRYLHNARGHVPEFKRLSFVLVGVATPGDLMRDPQRTPFNIGDRVDLTDFNAKEALPLLAGLGLEHAHAQEVLAWVLDWTGGHPYLTLRLCRAIAQDGRSSWQQGDLDALVAKTFLGDQAEKDNNLQFVRDMLTKRAANSTAVLTTYLDILRKPGHIPDEEQSLVKSHLKLSGVVQRTSGGVLRVRNKIYRKVFDERWVKNHLPATLKRRLQRTAIVSGATTMFAAIGILLIPLFAYAWHQKSNAEQAYKVADEQRRLTQKALAEAQDLRMVAEEQSKEAEQQKAKAVDSAQKESEARKQAESGQKEAQKQKEQAELQQALAVTSAKRERVASALAQALRKQAEDQEKLAKGGQLGAFAELTRNQQARLLKRSVLLAQESMLIKPTEVGYQALSQGLALLPEPVASLQHGERLQSIVFGKDRDTLIVVEGNITSLPVASRQNATVQLWTTPVKDSSGRTKFSERNVGFGSFQNADNSASSATSSLVPLRKSSLSARGKYLAEPNAQHPASAEPWALVELETGKKSPLPGSINSIPIFSPDERYVATVNVDDTVNIWETDSLRSVGNLPNPRRPDSGQTSDPDSQYYVGNPLVFSANGAKVAITVTEKDPASNENKRFVRIYETSTAKRLANLPADPSVGVQFSPDATGQYFATLNNSPASGESYVQVWDVASQKPLVRLFPSKRINRVIFSPDGKYIAVASDDFTARVWEIATGREAAHITHEAEVTDLDFSPDGKYLATASADTTARIWDWASGREISRLIHEQKVNAVAFSPEGDWVATAGDDHVAQIWKVARSTDSDVNTRENPIFLITPDGNYIARATDNKHIRVQNMKSGKETSIDFQKTELILFSPTGKYVGAISDIFDDPGVQWWDSDSGTPLTEREPLANNPLLAISASGKFWVRAIADPDKNDIVGLRVIDKTTGREMRLEGKPFDFVDESTLEFVKFSGNEKYLIASAGEDDDHVARILNLETGVEVPFHETAPFSGAAFSPQGDYVALAFGKRIRILRVSTWRNALEIEEPERINKLLFSPEGSLFATASDDNTARVWSTSPIGDHIRMLQVFTHEGRVISIAFSHDHKFLATASTDNTTRVWNIATGVEVARQTTADVVNVAFAPDDNSLAIAYTAREDVEPRTATVGQLWLWSPTALLDEACARLAPNLTAEDWKQYEEWHKAKIGSAPLKTCSNLTTGPAAAPASTP